MLTFDLKSHIHVLSIELHICREKKTLSAIYEGKETQIITQS